MAHTRGACFFRRQAVYLPVLLFVTTSLLRRDSRQAALLGNMFAHLLVIPHLLFSTLGRLARPNKLGRSRNIELANRPQAHVDPTRNQRIALQQANDAHVKRMLDLIDEPGWKQVARTQDEHPITIYVRTLSAADSAAMDYTDRQGATVPSSVPSSSTSSTSPIVSPPSSLSGGSPVVSPKSGAGQARRPGSKFACVKACAVLDACPLDVYSLFLDNARVSEYNEHCAEVVDVEILSNDTKIVWSATNKFGPFKARDFVTMVHFREAEDGSLITINCPARHPDAPSPQRKFQRAELLLGGNVIRPMPGARHKTHITMITHVNPGGIVDNPIGAAIINKLCAQGPIDYLRRLEKAASSPAG